MDHAYGDMLKDVSQVFGQLSEKYPIESLKRSYKEIEGLHQAKETFETVMYKHVRDSCGFSGSYSNFLISLFKLFEEYPRLCYCSVPIRTFCSNMKLIREKCSEHKVFWSILS